VIEKHSHSRIEYMIKVRNPQIIMANSGLLFHLFSKLDQQYVHFCTKYLVFLWDLNFFENFVSKLRSLRYRSDSQWVGWGGGELGVSQISELTCRMEIFTGLLF